ncbi:MULTISPECIES: NAD(P)-dependent oxidoreductase [unclassified Pseudomonas]|uniref:NAD(P)-dependent oxidoreductase n=1 Tax=unclassified Pseudomonas TaxID=196821 RepID=UPI0035C03620
MSISVGLIGLGKMGHAICNRLLDTGVDVHIHNRTYEKAEPLIRRGATWKINLKALAASANIILVCVSGDDALRAIYYSDLEGLLSSLEENQTVVDFSTLSAESAIELHQAFGNIGTHYLECPISGGVEGAIKGQLSAIVSGSQEAYSIAHPTLTKICKSISYVKQPGKAQRLKILNNLAESINLAGALEVIHQGQALGLDLDSMADVFTSCRGRSAYMQVSLDYILSGLTTSHVTLAVRCKDLNLAKSQLPDFKAYPATAMAIQCFTDAKRAFGDNGDQCQYFSLLATDGMLNHEPT